MVKARKKKAPRSPNRLSTLDDLLKADGKLEEFRAKAIKEILALRHARGERRLLDGQNR